MHPMQAVVEEPMQLRPIHSAQHVASLARVEELEDRLKQSLVSTRQLHERRDVLRHRLRLVQPKPLPPRLEQFVCVLKPFRPRHQPLPEQMEPPERDHKHPLHRKEKRLSERVRKPYMKRPQA